MRFVAIDQVKEGMVVGRKIIGQGGQLLLNYGAKIQPSYIKKIKALGYIGIYIVDDISSDIDVEEVIDDTLRIKAVDTYKSLYKKVEQGQIIQKKDVKGISDLVNNMLDKILFDKNIMINMLDLKIFDDYTFSHSVNVGVLSMSLGACMNIGREKLYNLGLASIMHDLGKVFVPKEILNKPGKLTPDEFVIMKTHSEMGYRHILKNFEFPLEITAAVLDHHERYDGMGYPNGKEGKQISKLGSIISVADVYDALTSDRPYRKALNPSEAVEYIMGGCNTQFSEKPLKAFLSKIAPYPVGTLVTLSNNTVGIVVENYSDCCLRPKVKIIFEQKERVTPYIINLKKSVEYFNVTITGTYSHEI